MKKRCYHSRNSWLIMGGQVEWCWRCGAYRMMQRSCSANAVSPSGPWARPTGSDGDNPWERYEADTKRWHVRNPD